MHFHYLSTIFEKETLTGWIQNVILTFRVTMMRPFKLYLRSICKHSSLAYTDSEIGYLSLPKKGVCQAISLVCGIYIYIHDYFL